MTPSPDTPRRPLTPRQVLMSDIPGVLSLWEAEPVPDTAHDLLALWAGLQRLERPTLTALEEELERCVRSDANRLRERAGASPALDLDAWMQNAGTLDQDTDAETYAQEELNEAAADLFHRLDRAALTSWAIEQLGGQAPALAFETAHRLIRTRVDLFLDLADELDETLDALRADLDEVAPGLIETLSPFATITAAREAIETPADPRALLRPLPVATSLPQVATVWFALPEPVRAMAAETSRTGGLRRYEFQEPGGLRTAKLVINLKDAMAPVRINFYREGRSTHELDGQPVTLAGCPGKIEAGGVNFAVEALRQAQSEGRVPNLCVGQDALHWPQLSQEKAQ